MDSTQPSLDVDIELQKMVQSTSPTISILPFSTYGIYSSTGFDLVGILARLIQRPNPKIAIGPIDLSCSFVIADAMSPDNSIVYVSETFEK